MSKSTKGRSPENARSTTNDNNPRYIPRIHNRRSIRLKGYDYAQAGMYFITICCQDRACRFGKIVGGNLASAHASAQMALNAYGRIAYNEWKKLPERFPNMETDVFQIMPNHMHGILVLSNPAGATLAVAPNNVPVAPNVDEPNPGTGNNNQHNNMNTGNDDYDNRARASRVPTVGDIVGAYKSLVARGCLSIYKSNNETMGKLWQRNYYEHIIRNESSYHKIVDYILNNPANW